MSDAWLREANDAMLRARSKEVAPDINKWPEPTRSREPSELERAVGGLFLWGFGLALFVGMAWAAISVIKWLWTHPLF